MKTVVVVTEEIEFPSQWLGTSDLAFTRQKRRKRPPIFNVSEPTIWRWVAKGVLPKPIQMGGKSFWSAKDIQDVIRRRLEGRHPVSVRKKRYRVIDKSKGKSTNSLPPLSRLIQLLDYDPHKGTFHWRVDVGNRQAGDPAGSVLPDRHCITIDGKNYQARRIAWYLLYGEIPQSRLYARNGDLTDHSAANITDDKRQANLGSAK